MDPTINRLLVALASLLLNLGARHLPGGLSPRLQSLTASQGMRMAAVWAMFYLSTRDIMLSIALTFIFFVIVSTILNEDSRYTLIERIRVARAPALNVLSRESYDAAVRTVMEFRRQSRG